MANAFQYPCYKVEAFITAYKANGKAKAYGFYRKRAKKSVKVKRGNNLGGI